MGSGVCKTPPERRGARRHPWAARQDPGCPLLGSQQWLAHGPPPQNRDKSSPCSGAPRTSPDTQGQRPASGPSQRARLLVWPLSSAAPGTLALSWRCTPGGGGRGGGQRASGLGWMKAWGLGFVLPICPPTANSRAPGRAGPWPDGGAHCSHPPAERGLGLRGRVS